MKFSRNNPYGEEARKRRKLNTKEKENACLEALNHSNGKNKLPRMDQRILVFDTETTGFSKTDCIIEFGVVEVLHGEITGTQFQSYVNANKMSHPEAEKVHGLTGNFLRRQRGVTLFDFFQRSQV
jgi:DNA polymerase III epsilon subunit-like protein